MTPIEENIAWIQSGKIGCTFATALVKMREKIGWKFHQVANPESAMNFYIDMDQDKALIMSLVFPRKTKDQVREIAMGMGMYIDEVGDGLEGLRFKTREGIAWVQYFGPNAHVKTRQSPHPMLVWTNKLPTHIYAKTMVKGILHLAHASIEFLSAKACDRFWITSHKRSREIIGHDLGIEEGAKCTFKV